MPLFKNPFKKSKAAEKGGKNPIGPDAKVTKGAPQDFGSNDALKEQVVAHDDDIALLDDLTEEKAKKPAAKKGGKAPVDPELRRQMLEESLIASGLMSAPKAPKGPKAPPEVVKDKHVKAKAKLGGGTANAVTKVEAKASLNEKGKRTGFFKKDDKVGPDMGKDAGIGQKKGDTHMAARSVASSRLDKQLGTNVLSDEKFAKVGGKKGVMSVEAEGKQASKKQWSEVDKDTYEAYFDMMGSDAVKKEGNKYFKYEGVSVADVDLARPETQKGMADLAVMDYLTGQVDRHSGNMFIDPATGKVTGIDNDMAFGTENYDEKHGKNGLTSMPDMIDAGTADKVLAMKPEEFVKSIAGKRGDYGKLSKEEIDAAKLRFAQMQAKCQILKLSGGLVDEWNQDTFDQSTAKADQLTDFDRGNDYMARLISTKKNADGTH